MGLELVVIVVIVDLKVFRILSYFGFWVVFLRMVVVLVLFFSVLFGVVVLGSGIGICCVFVVVFCVIRMV